MRENLQQYFLFRMKFKFPLLCHSEANLLYECKQLQYIWNVQWLKSILKFFIHFCNVAGTNCHHSIVINVLLCNMFSCNLCIKGSYSRVNIYPRNRYGALRLHTYTQLSYSLTSNFIQIIWLFRKLGK